MVENCDGNPNILSSNYPADEESDIEDSARISMLSEGNSQGDVVNIIDSEYGLPPRAKRWPTAEEWREAFSQGPTDETSLRIFRPEDRIEIIKKAVEIYHELRLEKRRKPFRVGVAVDL